MINDLILNELSQITDEENTLLKSKNSIDKSIYSTDGRWIINADKLLKKGDIITIRPHTRFVHFPSHTHNYVEVVYMCKGSTTHFINGTKIVLNQGELLFIGMNATHQVFEANKEDIAVNFIILPQFFDEPIKMIGENDSPLKKFLANCLAGKNDGELYYIHFECAKLIAVQNLIENLLLTIKSNITNKQVINKTTMGLIFMHLMGNTNHIQIGNNNSSIVMRAIGYIEENYKSGSLNEFAESIKIDVAQLSREFKSKTGQTYTDILQQKRLSQAAYLLKNTDLSVLDIATSVGYNNTTYFHKLFLKQYGLTPHKYRKYK